jgi:hypothetical protein
MTSRNPADLHAKRLTSVLAGIVFSTALCRRLARFFDPGYAGTFGDDFYYYLKIAMNVVAGKGSTFDGVIPTNGYHPLWMACVTVLEAIFGSETVLIAIAIVVAAATALTFVLSRALAARLIGSRGAVSLLIGAYTSAYFYSVAKYGMELIITVPALVYFMLRLLEQRDRLDSRRAMVATGALAALVFLCRVDSVIYVALFGLGFLGFTRGKIEDVLGKGLAVLLGFSPVFLYALWNHWAFGAFMQVSGAAKQLAGPSLTRFRLYDFSIASRFIHYFFLDASFLALWSGIGIIVFSKVVSDRFERWVVIGPIFAFNICYYVAQAVMSDWPLWDWYLYPVICATPVALAMVARLFSSPSAALERFVERQLASKFGLGCCVAVALIPFMWAVTCWRSSTGVSSMLSFAVALTDFAKTHPGRYAMGDRAGTVGYVLPSSLTQLEGLVEDRRLLDHIKAQHDLKDVLKEYAIDYYVSSAPIKDGKCYRTKEPFQAGPKSPRMRGVFCQEPVFTHSASDGTLSVVFHVSEPRTEP